MYLDSRILFTIVRHVKRLENLPRLGPHRLRHIPEPRDCRMNFFSAKFPFAGAELLLPAQSGTSRFQLRIFLPPRILPYAAAAPFLQHFLPLAPAGSVFSCSLVRRQFAASRSSIWVQIAHSSDRCFSACLLHLDLAHSVSAFCWFKLFHYVVPAVPVLVSWFEDFFTYVVTSISHVASVSPALL